MRTKSDQDETSFAFPHCISSSWTNFRLLCVAARRPHLIGPPEVDCWFLQKAKNDPISTLLFSAITWAWLTMRCSTRMRTPGSPPNTIRHLNACLNGPAAWTPHAQWVTLSVYSDAAVLITTLPADKQSDLQKKAAVEILLPYLSPGSLIPYRYHYINEPILLWGSTNVLV